MPDEYTPPASPTASFYDLSEDDEDYSTITHTSTGRGVKLLYTKSKVYVHPTPSAKDNIPGFIALMQQKPPSSSSNTTSSSTPSPSNLLLAWLPESAIGTAYDTYVKVDLLDTSTPPKQTYLVPPPPISSGSSPLGSYSFSIPVSQIYSLLVRPPSLGWWWGSIVINSRSGDSFPALFFHDSECASTIAQSRARTQKNFDPFGESGELFWGGDEVLRWLKRFVKVERSEIEKTVYLVDPSKDDLLSFGQRPVIDSTAGKDKSRGEGSSSDNNIAAAVMDPFTKAIKSARWTLLEQFAKVTQFSRQTANNFLDNPNLPPQVRKLLKNPDVISLQDDFDSARLYLARWAMGIAEQSEKERAKIVWKREDMMEMEDSAVGEFEILDVEAGNIAGSGDRRKIVEMKEWNSWWNKSTGRLEITVDEVKERLFHGGCDTAVRKEAWLFLLEVYPWDSSKDERAALMNSKRDEYVRLKGKWWDDVSRREGQGEAGEYWRDQKNRIEKDVHRTDRNIPIFAGEDTPHPDPDSQYSTIGTNVHLEQMKDMLLTYNEYNTTLGYVQGMSDLLAPIYAVFQDDAVAFWAFVGFMERMERNFLRDQSGMRAQLVTLDQLVQLMDPVLWKHLEKAESTNFFFFFRMILVWYKREFEWNDVLRLWEGLWTNYLSGQFHLFVALAVLERHRAVIMDHLQHFDEVLKYINELSGTIELNSTLIRAEALFYKFQRTIEASDRKHGFPSPGTTRPMVRLTHRRTDSSTATTATSNTANSTGTSTSSSAAANKGKAVDKGDGPEITEQLRGLLARDFVRVEKKEGEEGKGKTPARE
ncbi:GTPase activating protein [Orbilia ellipsospora]|uniref:GTPase-activating protein GYP7 n=1 Tax=Orbilia ellipsospora TaxID=2528407 RepID=A0AAV9XIA2_9PEZI